MRNSPRTKPPSDAILERLTRLHPKIIDLSLGRVERLLARLGHPERALPPVVHVAGTNGKGSVIAYLAAMLQAAGRTVHAYVSPHLVRFHERITLAGRPIAERRLSAILAECEDVNGGEPITFFEITTAAAMLAFNRTPGDVLLLETGLGGRLDATNVVDAPRLSVITPVSIDHVQYLGDDLAGIAAEKAGILKRGVPAVIGPQPAIALEAIRARAEHVRSPLYAFGESWTFEDREDGLGYRDDAGELRLPKPRLLGAHQVANAAIAVAAARRLGDLQPDEPAVRRGLLEARWPARLQRLSRGALADLAARRGGEWEVWLDGGHNAAAGEALAAMAARWRDRPLYLVYGMLNTKAAQDFLRPLSPHAASLHAVAIPGVEASLTAEEAAAEAAAAGLSARTADDVEAALAAILETAPAAGRVLICGSLYLAGRVLADNG
ncbi:MAG TPA: folylpolyglutamate synthase/dihydrofolate synthase family protein [Kiloniellales bacterium]